jgi:hypothetical protein
MMSAARHPHYVTPFEYLQLAISTRKLIRADIRLNGFRGLADPASEEQFLVDEDRLHDYGGVHPEAVTSMPCPA